MQKILKNSGQDLLAYCLALLVALICFDGYGQIKKGEKFMQESRYQEAIKPLRKAFESEEYNREAGLLLIESYYKLQQYPQALEVATLLDLENTEEEEEALWYADILVTNNDFTGAYLSLLKFISMGGYSPVITGRFEKVSNLLRWDTVSTGSDVSEIAGLNTVYNEYAPTITEDGLTYIADHFTVQTLYASAFTNQSLHLLFSSTKSSARGFTKPKMVLRNREYYYHDGPLEAIPGEPEKYALTLREIEGLMYDLKMNIFFTKLTGKEDDLEEFKYNGKFNTGHPSFSEDGNRIYFTSDRPGGFGGLDIWYSDKENGEWGVPVNAGPVVNSPSNELYPKVSNKRLFFTSDRRDLGYGGLDLYYVSMQNDNPKPYNLRSPINSQYDDFALDFSDPKNGYFSSNRTTGFGGDDIYEFYFQPATTRLDSLTFALRDEQNNVKSMKLFDSEGNELEGVDDGNGNMVYGGVLSRELYTLTTDSLFASGVTLVVYNEDDEVVKEFASNDGEFQVEFLEQEDYELAKSENEDASELFDLTADYGDSVIEDSIVFKLNTTDGTPIDFQLFDRDGSLIEGERNDSFSFIATGIKSHQQYTIVADSSSYTEGAELVLLAYNSEGALLKTFTESTATFDISFLEQYDYALSQQENEDTSLMFDLTGQVLHDSITDYANVSVLVKDENGGELEKVQTDPDGIFEIKNLSYETKYYLSILGIIDEAEMDILGETGAPIQAAEPGVEENSFVYARVLSEASWMEETPVRLPMVFAMVPYTELGEGEQPELMALDSSFTRDCPVDENDFIQLGSLITGRAYALKFKNTAFNPADRLVILDGNGDSTQTVRPNPDSTFVFELMPPSRQEITEEEPVVDIPQEAPAQFSFTGDFGDAVIDDTVTFKLNSPEGELVGFNLLDSNGNQIEGNRMNDLSFIATKLLSQEEYTVVADTTLDGQFVLNAYNSDGVLLKSFAAESSVFNITFLEDSDYELTKQDNEDGSGLYGLSGVVLHDTIQDFSNVSVLVKDENGGQIDEIKTATDGSFEVTDLSYETKYYLSILGIIDGEAEIDIIGSTGAPIESPDRSAGANTFAYTRARPEASWMTTTSLKLPMIFAIVPAAELGENEQPQLSALDSSFTRPCVVDEDDFIMLGSLTTGRAYELKFNETTFNPSDRLVILDGYGDTTQTVRPDQNAGFVFELMPPSKKVSEPETEMEPDDEIIAAADDEDDTPKKSVSNLYGKSEGLSKGDEISVYSSSKELLVTTYADDNGRFTITQIPVDSLFFIKTKEIPSLSLTSAYHGFDRKGVLDDGFWRFDFTAEEEMDKVVQLDNIYYGFDSFTLTNESKESLDQLYAFMRQNPSQKIKVLSHTDSRGRKAYNELLSNRRAREVVRYLIRRGIEEERLSYEGRGESQPINECSDGVWCPNEKHAQNRRTEFVLIKN